MFTGIVEACVPTLSYEARGAGASLRLPAPDLGDWDVKCGDSVAVCGACLTVAELEQGPQPGMVFDLSKETLERTWFPQLEPGIRVNLERAMCLGGRLDGHMVAGHVDGKGRIAEIADDQDGGRRYTFEVEERLSRYLVDKGSITLDGVSLTVVQPQAASFQVALIPLTLERTNLGCASVGTEVNVEVDLVGKWIERLALPATS